MRLRLLRSVAFAVLAVGALAGSGRAQGVSTVSGHVVDGSQHGVPNMQVKLRPPENASAATQIGVTDQAGAFSFARVPNGRYLLEVSQGPYVLYRSVTNVPQAGPVSITVQRR